MKMEILLRNVPEQAVITEQRMVDQAALESWLPGAMSRVHKAAGNAAAGTVDQPHLQRDHVPDEPVFIVIYDGNPNEGETAVECCTPLRAGVPAPADAAMRTIPAHREAYVRVIKSAVESGHIGDVYMAIEQWIGGNELDIAAAPRETYWTDFYGADGNDVVLDVAYPVR
jgi:effector-binding domain-containing protein